MARIPTRVRLLCFSPVAAGVWFGIAYAIGETRWGLHYDGADYGVVMLLLACLAAGACAVVAGMVLGVVGAIVYRSRARVCCILTAIAQFIIALLAYHWLL